MDYQTDGAALWALVRRQHGVISRAQLLEARMHPQAIKHRVSTGRLHRKARGAYAVGRADITRHGEFMVAVLGCGAGAVISHETAAELWGVRRRVWGPVEVSVPRLSVRRRPGLTVHSRGSMTPAMTTSHHRVPVTTLAVTIVDMALRWPPRHLEAAINQADVLDLLHVARLRAEIDELGPMPGVRVVRRLIDARTFRLTDAELERRFLRIVRRAGYPLPQTRIHANGHRVDFIWAKEGVVAEADSARFHRTALHQDADLRRDHDHLAAHVTTVRFSHHQITHQPDYVAARLGDAFTLAGARGAIGSRACPS